MTEFGSGWGVRREAEASGLGSAGWGFTDRAGLGDPQVVRRKDWFYPTGEGGSLFHGHSLSPVHCVRPCVRWEAENPKARHPRIGEAKAETDNDAQLARK